MFPLIKLLKIALPVATVTSATIATVSLVSSKKEDEILDGAREDKVLDDIEKPAEKFEEQIMLYSKDGTQESKTITKEELEQLSKTKSNSETKDSSLLTAKRELSEGAPVEPKSEDVPNQASTSDVSARAAESDQQVAEDKSDTTRSLTDSEKNRGGKDAGDEVKEDKPSMPQSVEVQTQNLDNLSSVDTPNSKKEESEGREERGEQQKEGQSEHEGNESDSESTQGLKSPEDSLSREGNGDLQTKATSYEKNTLDAGVSSDSLALSGSSENMDGGSGIDSSSGQENGLQGEHGQGPMTEEQFQRIAAMGQEVENVLDALGSLFVGNF